MPNKGQYQFSFIGSTLLSKAESKIEAKFLLPKQDRYHRKYMIPPLKVSPGKMLPHMDIQILLTTWTKFRRNERSRTVTAKG